MPNGSHMPEEDLPDCPKCATVIIPFAPPTVFQCFTCNTFWIVKQGHVEKKPALEPRIDINTWVLNSPLSCSWQAQLLYPWSCMQWHWSSWDERYYTKTLLPTVSQKENVKRYHWRTRKRAILKLGGKCMNCGETNLRVLQLNHINGGGRSERKRRNSYQISMDVLKEKRTDIDVRCANCNIIYEYERGRYTEWSLEIDKDN